MSRTDLIELEGTVGELLPKGLFRLRLNNGGEALAYTSGKLKKNQIRVLAGDRVTVEMAPDDLTRGRISFRSQE